MNTPLSNLVFGRDEETQDLRRKLARRRPFLFHGPAGVGKTLLLRNLLPEFPDILYCENSQATLTVFRSLTEELLRRKSRRIVAAFRDAGSIKTKSAVSLKGIVMDALREANYSVLLDHLNRPSHAFAAVVREVSGWGGTPVIAVARSCHMEDVGFLQSFYLDRSEKYELRNFDSELAGRFAREIARRRGLSALNVGEFLQKSVEFSAGNPGALLALLKMGGHPKYRSADHIKIAPLYIDFRMNWSPAKIR